MSFDLYAEILKAKFFDWVNNNKNEIIDELLLEHEDILLGIYSEHLKGGDEY